MKMRSCQQCSLVLVAVVSAAVFALQLHTPEKVASLPKEEALPHRVRFGVRRRRETLKRVKAVRPAPDDEHTLELPGSLPTVQKAARRQILLERSDRGRSQASDACQVDGTERGDGCHGQPCLMGTCICGTGTGGDWCERGALSPRDCSAQERQAYPEQPYDQAALTRHAPHDVCAFYDAAFGVIRVDQRRWRAAQEWEAALWAGSPASQTTDRNEHHRHQFGEYSSLPPALGRVIELGCGPYTQLQTILGANCTMDSATLVDPLASFYAARVKGCTYRDGRLLGREVTLLPVPAEELALDHPADTLVMVSILQAVRDVLRVLQVAYNALRVGGILVFADRVFDGRWDAYGERTEGGEAFWDVGHPCSIKETMVDQFLSGFEEMHMKRFSKPSSQRGQPPDEQVYFIGRKLKPTSTRTGIEFVRAVESHASLRPALPLSLRPFGFGNASPPRATSRIDPFTVAR